MLMALFQRDILDFLHTGAPQRQWPGLDIYKSSKYHLLSVDKQPIILMINAKGRNALQSDRLTYTDIATEMKE